MTGSGRPFAMQTRVTLLPSFTVMSEEILEIFGGTVKTKESWTLLLLEDSRSDLLTCLLINQRQPQTPLTGCAPHYYLVFWTVSVLQVQGPGFSVDKKINSSATTFWWCRHVKKKNGERYREQRSDFRSMHGVKQPGGGKEKWSRDAGKVAVEPGNIEKARPSGCEKAASID